MLLLLLVYLSMHAAIDSTMLFELTGLSSSVHVKICFDVSEFFLLAREFSFKMDSQHSSRTLILDLDDVDEVAGSRFGFSSSTDGFRKAEPCSGGRTDFWPSVVRF